MYPSPFWIYALLQSTLRSEIPFLISYVSSAPFLKDRFYYAKGRRSFFGCEGHLVLSIWHDQSPQGVERMLKGILGPQFSRAHVLWKLRELIALNSFEKLLLLLRAIGKFSKWNFITMDGKARQTSTLPIASGFQFQMGIF